MLIQIVSNSHDPVHSKVKSHAGISGNECVEAIARSGSKRVYANHADTRHAICWHQWLSFPWYNLACCSKGDTPQIQQFWDLQTYLPQTPCTPKALM